MRSSIVTCSTCGTAYTRAQVQEAVLFAETSPWPEDDEVYHDIYV